MATRSAVAEFHIGTAFVEAMACERADGIVLKPFTGTGFAHLLVGRFVSFPWQLNYLILTILKTYSNTAVAHA